jgi:hypothetical protein
MRTLFLNSGANLKLLPQYSLIETIDSCLTKNPQATATLHLVYSTLWELWLAQNSHQFQGTPRFFSALLTSKQADDHLYAIGMVTKPSAKLQRLRSARQHLITLPTPSAELQHSHNKHRRRGLTLNRHSRRADLRL